ncbi:MAG: DUF2851 family protein [Sphingobacteriaceae bacterium]|nr:DUF2851 family protein [Sphingobacteriaceae bacterium]
MDFNEDFLHYLWQFRLFEQLDLKTENGESLLIVNNGFANKNSGPDFSLAKIEIAGTTWIGNVEIHLKSSDWLLHNHQQDGAYDNVVLHVVYENDQPIYRSDGTLVPVLTLKDKFDKVLLINYQNLIQSNANFACERQIKNADTLLIDSQLSRTLVERLEQKSEEVYHKLDYLKGNWDETFYHFMGKNFGFKVNALPMEMLVASLPQTILGKHKDSSLAIESLIFGQAGFLNQTFEEEYPQQLKESYLFLQKKYGLKPIDVSLWKFMRMRPQNFPTLRLAQFAALIVKSNHLFSKVLDTKKDSDLNLFFEKLPVNNFWKTHYHFNKKADSVRLQLGKSSIQNLLINTVSLFLFAYDKFTDAENYSDRSLKLLESIPAEKNAIVDLYKNAGMKINNAFLSQAVLQLKKEYCTPKKCLSCAIGIKILKNNP